MFDAALIAALNHLLAGASWARKRLERFSGRQAHFSMPPFHLSFIIGDDGLFVPAGDATQPDVTIRLPADTVFSLPHGLDKVMAGARVEGNAEFATELSFILRNLRWDTEEDLSRLVGDIAATRIMQGARQLAGWQRQATTHFSENLAEYLLHEFPLLVEATELSAFRDDLVRLNAALALLEKRSIMLARQ